MFIKGEKHENDMKCNMLFNYNDMRSNMYYESNVMKYCDDRYSGRPCLWIPTKL